MHANRLIHASSPYLIQHAHNPVDWFEWGPEALQKALKEDKPILVSIGYSACHWCHVMERESFESEDIAQLMNEHFICIKVDREERPDIDHLYMEAIQAMQINGGWPLNVFLTPQQKPFYGGTYFPPRNWSQMLIQLSKAYDERRKEIDDSAEQLSQLLQVSDLQRFRQQERSDDFEIDDLHIMFSTLQNKFDNTWGGTGSAPKFVMPTVWMFLLRYYILTRKSEALEMVILTLKRINEGGLYDHLGGGFARYSVDGRWFAPHFEKMLYDNAQLLSLYAEAYAITGEPIFKNVLLETIGWVSREMMHPEGGFYSALDADSEGDEGKYYTWTEEELQLVLGQSAGPLIQAFQVTPSGNWEHGRNILYLKRDDTREINLSEEKKKLLIARQQRVSPALDDKILTGWNAMMIKGLTDAYNVLGEPQALSLAKRAMTFLEKNVIDGNQVFRSFRISRSVTKGFLEDYAHLIQGYIGLYQATFHEPWLQRATSLCQHCLEYFYDAKEGFFTFSGSGGERLIAGKKEIFDNVIPSSNSVMAHNLFHLGTLLDRDDWKKKATLMVKDLHGIIQSEPGYLSNWGILLTEMITGLHEVVVVGPEMEKLRIAIARHFLPFAVKLGTIQDSPLPLFEGRSSVDGRTLVYVCREKTCQLPVESAEDVLRQLSSN